jgi:hypothetical protein
MKTIETIIKNHGGLDALKEKYVRIENPGYMRLVIEYVGQGPRKLPLISVAHYYEQNCDAMRDPEMTFELGESLQGWRFLPVSYQQDGLGIYQEACFVQDGNVMVRPRLVKDLASFSKTWDRNLKEQGFITAGLETEKKTA